MNLYAWQFREELIELAENCTSIKPSTAKRKARCLFNKYTSIIDINADYYRKQSNRKDKIIQTIKTGVVKYNNGAMSISDISSIKIDETKVTVITKSGLEIYFDSEFEYLIDVI